LIPVEAEEKVEKEEEEEEGIGLYDEEIIDDLFDHISGLEGRSSMIFEASGLQSIVEMRCIGEEEEEVDKEEEKYASFVSGRH